MAQSASQADATLEQAFLNARVTIGQWEARDGLTPSKGTSALVEKLAKLGVSRQGRATQP